jgi:hypothetical protein
MNNNNYRKNGFNNPRKYIDDLKLNGKKYMPLKYTKTKSKEAVA